MEGEGENVTMLLSVCDIWDDGTSKEKEKQIRLVLPVLPSLLMHARNSSTLTSPDLSVSLYGAVKEEKERRKEQMREERRERKTKREICEERKIDKERKEREEREEREERKIKRER